MTLIIIVVIDDDDELDVASGIIGYGAVKYFDLKQHPSTDYIFSYDRMLDTKGDTAVYLLFAYARLASILRKVFLLDDFFLNFFCDFKKKEANFI
jgi:arginyl-tRNA synthetase